METEYPICVRIQMIYRDLGFDQQAFAQKLGYPVATISNYVTGRSPDPKASFIMKLWEAFPRLNLHWFLFGDGEMWHATGPDGKKIEGNPTSFMETPKDKITRLLEEKVEMINEIYRLKEKINTR